MSSILEKIREALKNDAPHITEVFFDFLAPQLIPECDPEKAEKTFNDPVWKNINLPTNAIAILQLPLLQRLRYVRQLGVAHMLYLGAHHNRLEHCIGCAYVAGRMFDALHASTEVKIINAVGIRTLIICAALLHDCGHAAFSHSSENFMESILHQEWEHVRVILGKFFPQTYAINSTSLPENVREKLPSKAAELASILFILSPAFTKFIAKMGWDGFSTVEAAEIMAGLVMGRLSPSFIFDNDQKLQHNYIAHIISGDLDSDKIDYVARDAYYAGLNVTVETERLLGQLKVVKVDKHTIGAQEAGIIFNSNTPSIYYLFGICPAGISALEMFVFTRSYLFDRIYTHHKVNSAEMLVGWLLGIWKILMDEANGVNYINLFDHLYGFGGDDELLTRIRFASVNNYQIDDTLLTEEKLDIANTFDILSKIVNDIFLRNLPYRAMAISMRALSNNPGMEQNWNNFLDSMDSEIELQKFQETIEECITKLDYSSELLFVCPFKKNPIKENPDIWIACGEGQTLSKAGSYFQSEQLANAYRDMKMVQWIFCSRRDIIPIAAASAWALYNKYGVLPGHEAFEKCKISKRSIIDFLQNCKNDDAKSFGDLLKINATDIPLKLSENFWRERFSHCSKHEHLALSNKLNKMIEKIGVHAYYRNDIYMAGELLDILISYANINWGKISFASEKEFQSDLVKFLKNSIKNIFIDEHTSSGGGVTDIVVTLGYGSYRFVVELKNTTISFDNVIEKHAGQSAAYASESYLSPVSFLFTTFFDETKASRSLDCLTIRQSSSEQTKHVIFCIGLMRDSGKPSEKGRYSSPIK